MGDVLLSAKERLKVNMRNAAAPFERFEGDTGSTEVQGAPARAHVCTLLLWLHCICKHRTQDLVPGVLSPAALLLDTVGCLFARHWGFISFLSDFGCCKRLLRGCVHHG